MSVTRNFRVTVHLSNFFHDHRNRARIFINDDIQTISDLHERIGKIFNIQNFHLTSQNDYLPPSEDARILQKDDIVWVLQNGEQYRPPEIPETSSKKTGKKSRSACKKRSISLTEEHIEEELRSPKKKKKKKSDFEKHKEICNVSDQLSSEPTKKKKKKHTPSDSIAPEELVDEENADTMPNLPIKGKRRDTKPVDTSNEDVSTTLEEDLSKSKVMKINKLLPVLHSHINTYNKKITKNHLNKTSPLAEISSSTIVKDLESDDDKKYVCKGNLSLYKKNVKVPTITDKYLNEKKINIVKIEYLGGKPGVSNLGRNTESAESMNQNSLAQETVNKNAEARNFSPEDVNTTLTMENTSLKPRDKIDTTDYSGKAAGDTNCDTGKLNAHISEENTITGDIQGLFCRGEKSNVYSELGMTFLSDKGTPSDITEENNVLMENNTNANSSVPTADPVKPAFDSHANFNASTLFLPANPGENSAHKLKQTFKAFEAVFRPKFFSLKEITSNNGNIEKADYSPNMGSVQNQVKDKEIDVLTPQEELTCIDSVQTCDKGLNEPNLEVDSPEIKSDPVSENVTSLDQSLPSNELQMLPNDCKLSFMDDSGTDIHNRLRNSDVSEMDITKDVSKIGESSFGRGGSQNTPNFAKRKQQSGVGHLLEKLRNDESVASMESVDSDCSEFITKRPRKRVRKRRKKNADRNSDTSLNDSSLTAIEMPVQRKPLSVKASPSIHIKFEEDGEGTELKVTHLTGNRYSEVDNSSYVENIIIKSDLDESKMEDVVREEDILKSPSMKKMLPKVGDFIAFKILRITDNYTPEVSSYITGKVKEFNTGTKQITFEILSGLDQCEEPKGKLSLELDGTHSETGTNEREFNWMDLLDPRLLYP